MFERGLAALMSLPQQDKPYYNKNNSLYLSQIVLCLLLRRASVQWRASLAYLATSIIWQYHHRQAGRFIAQDDVVD